MVECSQQKQVAVATKLLSVYFGRALDDASAQCCLPADGCYLQITVHRTWKAKNVFVPLAVMI